MFDLRRRVVLGGIDGDCAVEKVPCRVRVVVDDLAHEGEPLVFLATVTGGGQLGIATSVEREYPYRLLSTLSSGYDSTTVAVLARRAGCREVVGFDGVRGGGDDNGGDLTEFSLSAGFVQATVPSWGGLQRTDIGAIGDSSALDPWRIGGRYDRPSCRRIVEEGGVPRGMFAERSSRWHG